MTKVYHPNVKSDGQICTLSFNWAPQMKAHECKFFFVFHIFTILETHDSLDLKQVVDLLEHPSGDDDPLEPSIGNLFKNDYAKFEKTAKKWTAQHAK